MGSSWCLGKQWVLARNGRWVCGYCETPLKEDECCPGWCLSWDLPLPPQPEVSSDESRGPKPPERGPYR